MENREELLSELLKLEQRNYMQVVEIERLTKELGDMLARNDRNSAQLLLAMRKDEMDKVSEVKRGIYAVLDAVNPHDRAELAALLNGELPEGVKDREAVKIVDISRQMKGVLDRTISIDKVINRKLAGENSYYEQKADR